MSIKIAKKIGFFSALAMLVGSVVGIGIFFKNGSVLKSSEFNGGTALTAWIVGGVLSIAAALSFSEIGSLKTKMVSGLPAWSEAVGGKKYGYFVRFTFPIFYLGILVPVIGFFVSELFFYFLKTVGVIDNIPPVWINALLGLFITIFSLVLNAFSVKLSGFVQKLTTIIKFFPILLALIIGLIFPNTHNLLNDKGEVVGKNYFNESSFTMTGLIMALPAVLFSYDAFLVVGQMSNKVKGETKTVSKVVLFGMIGITILYSLLSVSALLHNGNLANIIKDSLPASASKSIEIFVFFTLFVSGYGVLNGLSAGAFSSYEQLVKSETIFGTKKMVSKISERKTVYLFTFVIMAIGLSVSYIPTVILDTDQYIDAVSNLPTFFFFAIYAITIFLYLKKRKDLNTKKMNDILFKIFAWIFILGVGFVFSYQLFYGFTIKLFLDIKSDYKGLGLFAHSSYTITNIDFFIILLSFTVLFILPPFINKLLIKK